MPRIGFGVFQVAPEETAKAVSYALEAGYAAAVSTARYVDLYLIHWPAPGWGLFDFTLDDGAIRTIQTLDAGERTGPDPATFDG